MTRAGRLFALPWVLLALLLQFGAAVAATQAEARTLGDPFAAIPICSPNDPAKTNTGGKAPAGHHGDHHCALCLVAAVAHPAPLAEAAAFAPRDLVAVASPAASRHRLPRGPPERVPNARGPPTLA